MDDDRLYKTLDSIWNKVNETRCDVSTLIEKTDELKRDVERLSEIPPKIAAIDTRLNAAEKAIETGRARWWAITLTAISSFLFGLGSLIVAAFTRH